ncbi:hypothetical protein H6P81_009575 [Aristolochia fimbriata]|uniref:Uncharacterized protein n=1 Tax=Aristolochia fimbriata TaxID=158543 RepID=A0AAV7ELA6_ARIFI|nr:hypothetical protein H6P81_009575 [Aristolochia fimbriata]
MLPKVLILCLILLFGCNFLDPTRIVTRKRVRVGSKRFNQIDPGLNHDNVIAQSAYALNDLLRSYLLAAPSSNFLLPVKILLLWRFHPHPKRAASQILPQVARRRRQSSFINGTVQAW